jgi:uncharacterized protein
VVVIGRSEEQDETLHRLYHCDQKRGSMSLMAPTPRSNTATLQQEFGGLYAFAKDVTASALAEESTQANLVRLSGKLARLAEKEISRLHGQLAEMGDRGLAFKPACSKGCWFCCTHVVVATAPEILLLADHIRTTWNAEAIRQLHMRIEAHKDALADFRSGRSATPPRFACPLLEDGACSVWLSRPLVCRGWNSVRVEDCKEKMERPHAEVREHGFAPQVAVADFIRQGMSESLASSGVNGELCELALGLQIALDIPEAGDRYAAGEDVFAPARSGLDGWS